MNYIFVAIAVYGYAAIGVFLADRILGSQKTSLLDLLMIPIGIIFWPISLYLEWRQRRIDAVASKLTGKRTAG